MRKQRRVYRHALDLVLVIQRVREELILLWLEAVRVELAVLELHHHQVRSCRVQYETLHLHYALRFVGIKTVRYVDFSIWFVDWLLTTWLLECTKESRKDSRRGPNVGTRNSGSEFSTWCARASSSEYDLRDFEIAKERSSSSVGKEMNNRKFSYNPCSRCDCIVIGGAEWTHLERKIIWHSKDRFHGLLSHLLRFVHYYKRRICPTNA